MRNLISTIGALSLTFACPAFGEATKPTTTTTPKTTTTTTTTEKQTTTTDTEKMAWAPEVTIEEFKKLVETKGATIIDVNGSEDYNKGHIPGAINFAQNETKLATVLPTSKTSLIVAYCGGPMCTAWEEAATKAKSMGYTNIKHFKGGIKVWKEKGYAVEKAPAAKAG